MGTKPRFWIVIFAYFSCLWLAVICEKYVSWRILLLLNPSFCFIGRLIIVCYKLLRRSIQRMSMRRWILFFMMFYLHPLQVGHLVRAIRLTGVGVSMASLNARPHLKFNNIYDLSKLFTFNEVSFWHLITKIYQIWAMLIRFLLQKYLSVDIYVKY